MDHRSYVGPRDKYDLLAATQFNLMTHIGLRERHKLLDIGCGSLRAGRLFIAYLNSYNYFGIEPRSSLVEAALKYEIGRDVLKLKNPTFSNDDSFSLTKLSQTFDFIIAQSIFSHASFRQIKKCVVEAKVVMHSASKFVATFYEGTKDYEGDKWVYPGCVTYKYETIKELIEKVGLRVEKYLWPHPNSQTWLLITKDAGDQYVVSENVDYLTYTEDKIELEVCQRELMALKNTKYFRFGYFLKSYLKKVISFFKRT